MNGLGDAAYPQGSRRKNERQGERQRIYSMVEKTDRGTQSPGKQTERSGELAGGQVQSMGS